MINMRSKKVQTGLRLDPMLINRLKSRAKLEGKSFNSYVEEVLEREMEPIFPKLRREDYRVPDWVDKLAVRGRKFSKEELEADPRLAHIWGEEEG